MSVITYVEGNIVDAMNRGENVVHCVSADFEMGIGVAKALVSEAIFEPVEQRIKRDKKYVLM